MKSKKEFTGKQVEYKEGEIVFAEGTEGKEIYFILNGRAEVSGRIGMEKRTTAILTQGELFGEMAALNDDDRTMTVTAMGDLVLYELSLDEMFDHMQSNRDMLKDMCTALARRLRNTNLRVRELALRETGGNKGKDPATTPLNTDRLNVLLVDDHPNILIALERMLRNEYGIFTAIDGKNALEIMEKHDIAIVLADYRMPEMSGIELLENVKHMYPGAIRMIFSGYIDQGVLMKAISAVQVHEVLPKPWREEEIVFSLARWAEQYRKARELEKRANQYIFVQDQLEAANKLIQQLKQKMLTQETHQVSISEYYRRPWFRNWFKKKQRLENEQT